MLRSASSIRRIPLKVSRSFPSQLPDPATAWKCSSRSGSSTWPTTIRFPCRTPMETAKNGSPLVKFRVPSMGSTYQMVSASPGSPPISSPTTA